MTVDNPSGSPVAIFSASSAVPSTVAGVVRPNDPPLAPPRIPTLEEIDLVLGGGGSNVVSIAAVAYGVSKVRRVKRVLGTSAGSMAAACKATDMPAEKALSFLKENLGGNRLLDVSLWPPDRWGVFKGDALLRALERTFPGTLGETKIPLYVVVCDLWTRQPLVLNSIDHPDIPIAHAVRTSAAIPVFFKAFEFSRKYFGNRLGVDGGCAMNYAMDRFDDSDRQTIGVRVRHRDQGSPRPVRDLTDFAGALADLFMWSSDNAHISAKHYQRTIDVVTDFDGLDFSLSPAQVDERWKFGVDIANTVDLRSLEALNAAT